MAEVADGKILPDIQFEVAATGREHEASLDGRSPNNLSVHEALNVLQDRVALFAASADGGAAGGGGAGLAMLSTAPPITPP